MPTARSKIKACIGTQSHTGGINSMQMHREVYREVYREVQREVYLAAAAGKETAAAPGCMMDHASAATQSAASRCILLAY